MFRWGSRVLAASSRLGRGVGGSVRGRGLASSGVALDGSMNGPHSVETVDTPDALGSATVSLEAVMAQRQAAVTRTVLRVLLAAVVVVSFLSLLEPRNGVQITLSTYAPLAATLLGGLWLVRRGRPRTAA